MSRKNSKFWFGFRIYAGILVVLIVVLLIYTYTSMKKYEKAQPSVVMDKLIESLEAGDVSSIDISGGNKFEETDGFKNMLASELKGKELSYEMKTTSYEEMTYDILNGDDTVATVKLKADNHKKMFAILTICDWEIASVEAQLENGSNDVCITVPENYSVYINDVMLGSEEMSGEAAPVLDLEYVAQYTDVPNVVTYEVKGLVNTPVVKVLNDEGSEVDLSSYEDLSNINISYETGEMPEELKNYVIQAAKDYSNFFSKDLPGCSVSTDGIAKYFPEGSTYIELAENYRLHDMWMYSAHTGTEFIDLKVEDYTAYSDSLFSCSVSFTKRMVLKSGEERTEENDQVYYYVNIDGNWLIAAMMSDTDK